LGAFERLLPIRFAVGAADGRTFTVERALPGIGAGPRADTVAQIRAIAEATSAIGELHRHTAHEIVVDAAVLDSWIGGRVTIAAAASRNPAALRRLSCRLHAAWMGRRVSVGWVHGDFWLGNVLVDPKSGATTGIVDWEWAGAGELPAQDVIYACIHGRMQAQRRELGDVVAGLLGGAEWEPHERALLRATGVLAADRSRVEDDLLLLVWLRQVAYNLIQDPGLARSFIWVRRNLDGVLRLI
jgi:Predicted aminoglycoside phosphotransferase